MTGRNKAAIRDLTAEGSLTEFAYRRLRADIIAGQFKSGAKLHIDELKSRYGLSASPLREALSRLISQGFVAVENNRGFRVAPMSEPDLADIVLVRQAVEALALRRAMALGDDSWEAAIIAAYHRLSRYVERLAGKPLQDPAELGELHKGFHTALLAACDSPRLLDEHSRLYDQAERYRHRMLEQHLVLPEIMQEHRELMQLVLARKAVAAERALQDHLALTLAFCYGKAKQPEIRAARPRRTNRNARKQREAIA